MGQQLSCAFPRGEHPQATSATKRHNTVLLSEFTERAVAHSTNLPQGKEKTNAARGHAVSSSNQQQPRTVSRKSESVGFRHHLFLIGQGLHFPLGHEPYASFQVTCVKSAHTASSTDGSMACSSYQLQASTSFSSFQHAVSGASYGAADASSPTKSTHGSWAPNACKSASTVENTLAHQDRVNPGRYTATAIISAIDTRTTRIPGRQASPDQMIGCHVTRRSTDAQGSGTLEGNSSDQIRFDPHRMSDTSTKLQGTSDTDFDSVYGCSPSDNSLFSEVEGNNSQSGSRAGSGRPNQANTTATALNTDSTLRTVPSSLKQTPLSQREASVSPSNQKQEVVALPMHLLTETIAALRKTSPSMFIVLWHPQASEDGNVRADAFDAGANMVTFNDKDLRVALTRVSCQAGTGMMQCAWCGLTGMTVNDYWMHQPLYHIYAREKPQRCCVCCKDVDNLAVHIHEAHGPKGHKPEARTNYGSAVVVHRPSDNKFLMTQEFAGQGFWTPGGAADPGEGLAASAVRECSEEAGVDVEIKGLLEVQYDMSQKPPWRLAVFYAQPKDPHQPPKTVPDFESAGACWVSVDDLETIPHRDSELPCMWFPAIAAGTANILPLKIPDHAREQFKDLKI